MREGRLLGLAAGSNLCVALSTFALLGWNAGAAHAAARNTARFSSLWFAVAFAAPALARVFPGLPQHTRLIWAFVAAHGVHFAAVAVLIATFDFAQLVGRPGSSVAILLVGFILVVGAGLTARSRPSRLGSFLHSFTLYLLFLIFFLAFARRAALPLGLMLIPLVLALLLRLSAAAQRFRNPLRLLRVKLFNSKA